MYNVKRTITLSLLRRRAILLYTSFSGMSWDSLTYVVKKFQHVVCHTLRFKIFLFQDVVKVCVSHHLSFVPIYSGVGAAPAKWQGAEPKVHSMEC